MMDCCVKDCQSRPLNTKWPESSPMWSGAGCSLAVQTRQTTSDLSHIRFGPKSEKDSDLRFFTVWPRSDKVCTPISAGLLRHSRSPFFLIVPRREILAESFPGGGSHSDNAGWSWVCFRSTPQKPALRQRPQGAWVITQRALSSISPLSPVCSGNTPVSTARWLRNDTVYTHTSAAHPRRLVYLLNVTSRGPSVRAGHDRGREQFPPESDL